MDRLKISDAARGGLTMRPRNEDYLGLKGVFEVWHYRKGMLLDHFFSLNTITTQGKNKLFDVMFGAATQLSQWYIGLVNNAGFTAIAASDTYDGINDTNGWTEFAAYTDPANADSATTRPAWTEDAASSGSITNSSVVSFDITGSGTIRGIFLVGGTNAQTKSDSTASGNFLWNATDFSGGNRVVAASDTLKVSYSVSS